MLPRIQPAASLLPYTTLFRSLGGAGARRWRHRHHLGGGGARDPLRPSGGRYPRPVSTASKAPSRVEHARDAAPAPGRARRVVPWLLAALANLAYGLLGTQRWRNLVAPSWDLGIFTQLAKAYGGLDARSTRLNSRHAAIAY